MTVSSSRDIRQRAQKRTFLQRLAASPFEFLERLDDLTRRYIDNADFFSVTDSNRSATRPSTTL